MHDATDQRSNRVVLLISHLAAIYMHDRMYRHTRMKFFSLETFSASVVLEHALLLLIFITRICCAVFVSRTLLIIFIGFSEANILEAVQN